MTVDANGRVVETEFGGWPKFTNLAGAIQGGFLSAMLGRDESALASMPDAGEFAMTLLLAVSFFVRCGLGGFWGYCHVVRRSAKICHLRVSFRSTARLLRLQPRGHNYSRFG